MLFQMLPDVTKKNKIILFIPVNLLYNIKLHKLYINMFSWTLVLPVLSSFKKVTKLMLMISSGM